MDVHSGVGVVTRQNASWQNATCTAILSASCSAARRRVFSAGSVSVRGVLAWSHLNGLESRPVLTVRPEPWTVRSGCQTGSEKYDILGTEMRVLSSKTNEKLSKLTEKSSFFWFHVNSLVVSKDTMCSTRISDWRGRFPCFVPDHVKGPVQTRDRSSLAVGPVFWYFLNGFAAVFYTDKGWTRPFGSRCWRTANGLCHLSPG